MDDWDIDYYTKLFVEKVNRNPTSIECFDLAQSNRLVSCCTNSEVIKVLMMCM